MSAKRNELTHIAGTFLIQAEGAFLNGGGLVKGEYGNTTAPKMFVDFKDKVPYVSSQAWKRWLRNTFQEENPDLPHTELKQIGTSEKGTTNKIGTEMDPVKFAEDDIFGYMRAQEGQGKSAKEEDETNGQDTETEANLEKDKKNNKKIKSVMRPAPFVASILTSLRKNGWQGLDKAYVHLQEGTPQPYNTEFYNTQLQGIFGLNYSRLGCFRNEGDRIELDEKYVERYTKDGTIITKETSAGKHYEMADNPRKERAAAILKALAVMRGGAKQAQFATDVTPKTIVLAGLNCGNLIFNDLFNDSKEGPILKLNTFKEVIEDYKDRIVGNVFIGIRDGYLSEDNKQEVKSLHNREIGDIVVIVTSPIDAINQMLETLS